MRYCDEVLPPFFMEGEFCPEPPSNRNDSNLQEAMKNYEKDQRRADRVRKKEEAIKSYSDPRKMWQEPDEFLEIERNISGRDNEEVDSPSSSAERTTNPKKKRQKQKRSAKGKRLANKPTARTAKTTNRRRTEENLTSQDRGSGNGDDAVEINHSQKLPRGSYRFFRPHECPSTSSAGQASGGMGTVVPPPWDDPASPSTSMTNPVPGGMGTVVPPPCDDPASPSTSMTNPVPGLLDTSHDQHRNQATTVISTPSTTESSLMERALAAYEFRTSSDSDE